MSRYIEISRALVARPQRWLVTGAAGFIGSALVERLLQLGQQVIGIDNFATGSQRNLDDVLGAATMRSATFELVVGDITDFQTCRAVCGGVDIVLHQAALGSVGLSLDDPLATHATNVSGFLNVLLAAREQVKRVVYASSSAIYGDDQGLPKVESAVGRALSPYAASKRIDELYAQVVEDCYDLPIVGLRYFNVFGRRQDPEGPYAAVIPRWIDRLASGAAIEVYGDGSNTRDFCHVDNAVQANLLAALAPAGCTNAVYNVACGQRTTLLELFDMLRSEVARYVPAAANATPVHLEPRAGDILHSHASIAAIQQKLGFEPAGDLRAGLASTVARLMARRAAAWRGSAVQLEG